MHGLMMDVPLSIPMMLRRARTLFPDKAIVARRPDRSLHRTTYSEVLTRAGRLVMALRELGVRPGDRVATLQWNHARHIECYFGIPSMGAVLHTLNLRLSPDDLAYIVNHAEDRVVIVDKVLWPLWEKVAAKTHVEHVIAVTDDGSAPPGAHDYEALIASVSSADFDYDDIDEDSAAAMCYTSGTTGRPKGVMYSHRSITLHTYGTLVGEGCGFGERDILLPVVPMFHANAWGFPFTGAFIGAKQVHPGPHLDPASLLDLIDGERVTLACGVPTIWLGILQALEANPGKWNVSSLREMTCGGAACPESLIRNYKERHGVTVVQGWGMTELSPVGTLSRLRSQHDGLPAHAQFAQLSRQGFPLPGVELRARNDNGLVPWDGQTMGELEVRGPWVVRAYYKPEDPVTQFTDDGWFRTGDMVTIGTDGCITITDRVKDVIKSGGEWVSSVALETSLMGHADVFEAAVFGIPHPRWSERPLAVVVRKPGALVEETALKAWLAERFASWWVPDEIVFVESLPKTGTGKVQKSALREQYRERYAVAGDGSARASAATTA